MFGSTPVPSIEEFVLGPLGIVAHPLTVSIKNTRNINEYTLGATGLFKFLLLCALAKQYAEIARLLLALLAADPRRVGP